MHLSRTIQQLPSFNFSVFCQVSKNHWNHSARPHEVSLHPNLSVSSPLSLRRFGTRPIASLCCAQPTPIHTPLIPTAQIYYESWTEVLAAAAVVWQSVLGPGSPLPPTHFALEPCMLCVFVERVVLDGKRLHMHRVATTPMQNSGAAQTIPDSSTCLSATLAFQLRYNWSWSVQCFQTTWCRYLLCRFTSQSPLCLSFSGNYLAFAFSTNRKQPIFSRCLKQSATNANPL